MGRKARTSVRKREREFEKRRRELKKSQKAAEKRERRLERHRQDSSLPSEGADVALGQEETGPRDNTDLKEPGITEGLTPRKA
jgi:hypothetical protein